jgi:uncharacterized membrane protein YtjA (UPF0391 family)
VPSYASAAARPLQRRAAAPQTGITVAALSGLPHQERPMLHYAVVFLVIALIAAVFGFGGIATSAVGIAKILFFVFVVLAVLSFLFGLVRRP